MNAPIDVPPTAAVRRLTAVTPVEVRVLAELTREVVEAGASLGFMAPLTADRALAFWRAVSDAVARGDRLLLVAETPEGVAGTVQLVLDLPENQPHRADLAKMMVRPSARRHGLATALLRAAEDAALALGRTLLVLDTVTDSDAERLYARSGWQRCGVIPGYALLPRGGLAPTTVFYRDLATG